MCVYARMCGCTCICLCVHVLMDTHAWVSVCICAYACLCARVCLCVWAYEYILHACVWACTCVCVSVHLDPPGFSSVSPRDGVVEVIHDPSCPGPLAVLTPELQGGGCGPRPPQPPGRLGGESGSWRAAVANSGNSISIPESCLQAFLSPWSPCFPLPQQPLIDGLPYREMDTERPCRTACSLAAGTSLWIFMVFAGCQRNPLGWQPLKG